MSFYESDGFLTGRENRLHLTRERVRQIEARAKEKLRSSRRATGLRSYLN